MTTKESTCNDCKGKMDNIGDGVVHSVASDIGILYHGPAICKKCLAKRTEQKYKKLGMSDPKQ